MRCPRIILLTAAFAGAAWGADPIAARSDLDRARALVEAGALPRSALDSARVDLERAETRSRLRALFAKSSLTPPEASEMVSAARRLLEIERAAFHQTSARVEAGAVPVKELESAREALDFAEKQKDLAESRSELARELARMALAEQRLEELEEEELAFLSEGVSPPRPADLETLDLLFFETFGRPLPISAEGATALHASMGLDHAGRYDIAVHPDEDEGLFVMAVLESWRTPYIAFRSAVPGQSTGPHIHIGAPSPPLAPTALD